MSVINWHQYFEVDHKHEGSFLLRISNSTRKQIIIHDIKIVCLRKIFVIRIENELCFLFMFIREDVFYFRRQSLTDSIRMYSKIKNNPSG